MSDRILVCGGDGAGERTLGRDLGGGVGGGFADIEDYYFPKRSPDYPYGEVRSREEVRPLLLRDLRRHENIVIAAVKADFGREVEELFTCAVLVQTPRTQRLERVRGRSFQRFGERMQPGGDLYEKEGRFFDMVAQRPEGDVESWLAGTGLPVIRVDGTKPLERSASTVLRALVDGYGYRSSQR